MADVVIAYMFPLGGNVHGWFNRSLVRTLLKDRRAHRPLIEDVLIGESGPALDVGRDALVRTFLDHGTNPPWLMMFDTDMTWEPRDLFEFLDRRNPERPVVSGAYNVITNGDEIAPAALDGEGKYVWPEGEEPIPAKVVGAGALLVHRSVFNNLSHWFEVPGPGMNEDVKFSLRLYTADIPVFVDPLFRPGHVKSAAI